MAQGTSQILEQQSSQINTVNNQQTGTLIANGFVDSALGDLWNWTRDQFNGAFNSPVNSGEAFGLIRMRIGQEVNDKYPNATDSQKALITNASTLIVGERLSRNITNQTERRDFSQAFNSWKNDNRDVLGNANHLVSRVLGNSTNTSSIQNDSSPANVASVVGRHYLGNGKSQNKVAAETVQPQVRM
jgi:hypothetical protein